MPAGWQATALTETAQAEALARESDPRVRAFLGQRLTGLAAQHAVLYLYDFRGLAGGTLATAEVYRYAAGRSPQEAVEQVVLPALQGAGLTAVRGSTVLPAGPALTVTTRTNAGGKDVGNEVFVLPLGATSVGLSVTTVGPARADTGLLSQGLAAA